jgi:hypothetical protein
MNDTNNNEINDIPLSEGPERTERYIEPVEAPREVPNRGDIPQTVAQGGAGESEEVRDSKEMARRGPGRPPGAKNKATLFKELMTGRFESKAIADIEKVYEVLFAEAHGGNMKAIKMVLDRVVPVTKAVDMDSVKGGISVQVFVGSMEEAQNAEVVEDAEFTEVES